MLVNKSRVTKDFKRAVSKVAVSSTCDGSIYLRLFVIYSHIFPHWVLATDQDTSHEINHSIKFVRFYKDRGLFQALTLNSLRFRNFFFYFVSSFVSFLCFYHSFTLLFIFVLFRFVLFYYLFSAIFLTFSVFYDAVEHKNLFNIIHGDIKGT